MVAMKQRMRASTHMKRIRSNQDPGSKGEVAAPCRHGGQVALSLAAAALLPSLAAAAAIVIYSLPYL
jgi:hypothetical protein